MAELVQEWAGVDGEETRSGILVLALNLAAGHEAKDIEAWANGQRETEYGDVLAPMLALYGKPEDMPALKQAFRTYFEYDLRAAWDVWALNQQSDDYATVHAIINRARTKLSPS